MIDRLTTEDVHWVVADYQRYWGDRDRRSLHVTAIVQEFPETCLAYRTADEGILGYLIGFVTPAGVGYVHIIATRDDARGRGVGRALHEVFASAARAQGARRLKAITGTDNTASIDFHQRVGFTVDIVPDYGGPGRDRAVFSRAL
ncbi:GNAT family N-acetyltransferase [Longispora albida]|uniref:GNAT family N-acetyltransferase n=1 Tax=Longispora albida TaxID=203523 RepID=UPI000360F88F|nr:GNAT family N-acetyltransferase [Longispora albida]